MSYDINIVDPTTGETIETADPHHIAGGTYQVGGTTRLWLNITYNYSPFYYRAETLGESTRVRRDMGEFWEIEEPDTGGVCGLQYLTIPEARERVLRAINALRDEDIDMDGNPYQPIETFDGDTLHATNYWAPTERNARRALKNLLAILLLAPDNAKIQIS